MFVYTLLLLVCFQGCVFASFGSKCSKPAHHVVALKGLSTLLN
uniref:Uncharacterized protein n=1 Tax=Aegilops tauschii subsp. strangulata TaxID=200361 RepID=A0A453M937_AEGTS